MVLGSVDIDSWVLLVYGPGICWYMILGSVGKWSWFLGSTGIWSCVQLLYGPCWYEYMVLGSSFKWCWMWRRTSMYCTVNLLYVSLLPYLQNTRPVHTRQFCRYNNADL
jgi:hypothetical protein